jgi:hypothetical protein
MYRKGIPEKGGRGIKAQKGYKGKKKGARNEGAKEIIPP